MSRLENTRTTDVLVPAVSLEAAVVGLLIEFVVGPLLLLGLRAFVVVLPRPPPAPALLLLLLWVGVAASARAVATAETGDKVSNPAPMSGEEFVLLPRPVAPPSLSSSRC